MRASDCVGRVGALAVALGIGMAIATGVPGTAAATPEQDSTSATEGSAGRAAPSGRARTSVRPRGDAPPRRTNPRRDNPVPVTVEPLPKIAPPAIEPDLAPAPRPEIATSEVRTQPASVAPAAAAVTLPIAITPVATRVAATPLGSVASVRSPLSRTSGPGAPAQSTVGWVVLAAARRTGRPLPATSVAAPVSTGQAPDPTADATGADPIATLLFNQTPSQSGTQTGQGSAGVITGAIAVTDPDSDVFTYAVATNPARGSVRVDATGTFTYTPDPAFAHTGGTDTFAVTVSDAPSGFHIHGFGGLINLLTFGLFGTSGHTDTHTVTVTVAPVNTAPTGAVTVGVPDPATGVVTGSVLGADADSDPLTYTGTAATAKGSVVVSTDGSFVYTPTAAARHDAAALGATPAETTDAFSVTISDGYGGATAVPVTVAIAPANTDPIAEATVGEPDPSTGVVTGGVLATDADSDALSYSGSGSTGKGTVAVEPDGTFTYTPTADARHAASALTATEADRIDSVTLTVSDGHGGSVDVEFSVTIVPANAAPVGVVDVGSPDPDTGMVLGVVNASDADGDVLTYGGSATTSKGAVLVAADGGFVYTPTAEARHAAASPSATDADTSDSFTVTVSDGHGGTLSLPVAVVIDAANNAPVGTATVGLPDPATGVVAGAILGTDADSDLLTYTGTSTTAKGSVVVGSDGSFVYTPAAAARHDAAALDASPADQADSFTVTIADGYGGSTAVPVTVAIAPANADPVVSLSTGEPDASTGVVTGAVVATDGDGDLLSFSAPTGTGKGTLDVGSDGVFTYTPTADARHAASSLTATEADRIDRFTVTVSDGHGGSVDVEVSVTIVPANADPVGVVSVGSPDLDTGMVLGAVAASDADGDALTFGGSATTAKGAVLVAADGGFVYTPTAEARHAAASPSATDADRADTFTVTVSDGHGGTLSLPVTVVIGTSNTAPTGTASVGVPNPATGVVTGAVLGTDADGDPLAYTGTATTAKGAVVVNLDGSFVYTPTAAARHDAAALDAAPADQADSFTVTISDGHGGSTAVPVTVAIAPANADPVAGVSVGAPDPSTGVVTGSVLATDADSDALSYSGSGSTAKGAVVVGSGGAFTYSPTADARHAAAKLTATDADRIDTFTLTVSDGHGGTADVQVVATVLGANATPTATTVTEVPDATTGLVAGALLGADADGDTLSYSGSQSTTKGAVVVGSDGTFTYTPTALARHLAAAADATTEDTTDTFTLAVADGYGGVLEVPVTVAVSPASVTFSFVYGSGSQYWSAEARTGLETAAATLASYLVADRPVVLTYDVIGVNDAGSGFLATALAKFTTGSAGYYGTVVQNKIITGVDSNGSTTDSQISVNFAFPWAFGDTVGRRQYDFQSVAIHELVHTLGFITGMGVDPSSTDRNWTTYDSFLATADGTSPIGPTYVWNSAYTPNLTGSDGGLYFAGPNAVAVYGGLVPLYTPDTWAPGSSLTHLDPAYAPPGTDYLMDPFDGYGLGVREFSPVELGILADLGYTVHALFFVGFGGFRIRRRRR